MKTSRRTVLGLAMSSFGAALAMDRSLGAQVGARPLGAQLYTVRRSLAAEFDGTLEKVAAIGYREVEFAGYFDRAPRMVRASLDRFGLTAPAAHVDLDAITNRLPQAIEESKVIGHEYIVLPWLDERLRAQPDIWSRVAEQLGRAAEQARQAGLTIGYHNHQFEFVQRADGRRPFEILLEATAGSGVVFELDIAWITAAGEDPVAYFRRYPGRFKLVHLKGWRRQAAGRGPEGGAPSAGSLADVGSDSIAWPEVLQGAAGAGVVHYFVEHDNPAVPFDSLAGSFRYLRMLSW